LEQAAQTGRAVLSKSRRRWPSTDRARTNAADVCVAQQCFGLSDEGIEDAIYDSQAIRAFVGIDLGRKSAPDATTLLKFRHLLEAKDLTPQIFDAINQHLAEKGSMMREGTIVDATLSATVDEEQGWQA
jgi:IS5 family transposase